MKTKLLLLIFFITTLNSFAQIRPIKGKAVLKKAQQLSKPIPISKDKNAFQITMTYPNNEEIIHTNSPIFKFSLIQQLAKTQNAATKAKLSKTAVLTVVKLSDDPNWIAEDNIVLKEDVLSNLNMVISKRFNNLSLSINNAYAWNIAIKGVEIDENNMPWNVFYYFDENVVFDDIDPHECNNASIIDPSFQSKGDWKVTNTSFSAHNYPNTISQGHDDIGAAVIASPNTIIYQKLQTPIRYNKSYQLKFSLKQQNEKTPFRIKAIAFNGSLNSLTPSSDIAIMAVSGTIPYHSDWNKITLSGWKAPKDFENIALVFLPEGKRASINLLIDRICLSDIESACDENNITYDIDSANGNNAVTITNQEYLAGSVQDLYPNQDTSTANWYPNIADDCLAIGGDDSEEDEVTLNLQEEASFNQAKDESDAIISRLKQKEPKDFNSNNGISPITYNDKKSCKPQDPKLDPSKPFSGRDIVYIHGLQLKAILGNLEPDPTFQGKWPQDKHAFYKGGGNNPSNTSQDGEFYDEATGHYWNKHIERGLGSLTNPSNSYLIATYSANQRLDIGIHAVLTQIKEAMEGNNPNLVKSTSAKNSGECFGSNGIVVVTHSTGGLVASTMFGIAERSNSNQALKDYYGDVRFITSKIDAQVGIDAAYGGSALAEAGTAVLAKLTTNPYLQFAVKIKMNSDLQHLRQLDPFGTILYDLIPSVSATKWRPFMASTIPTLTLSGTTIGKSADGFLTTPGNFLIKGYDDGVLSPSSQSNSIVRRPRFKIKNRGKFVDKGQLKMKKDGIIKDSKSGEHSNIGYRNYYNTPYLSPAGMLQGNSVDRVIDPVNNHVPNHHTVLQTTGDHFDNVNLADRYSNGGYLLTNGNTLGDWASSIHEYNNTGTFVRPNRTIRNDEESNIVFNPALYTTGLLHRDFASINQEWIKKETWGFHAPKVILVRKCIRLFRKERCIKLPKITWHYYEYIKWQRKYHLLKDYETKIGMDYMYEYILR